MLVGIHSIFLDNMIWNITKLCFLFETLCTKVIGPRNCWHCKKNLLLSYVTSRCICIHPFWHDDSFSYPPCLWNTKNMDWLLWYGCTLIDYYVKILKEYMKNGSQPKVCIVERYIIEEVIEFLLYVEPIELLVWRHLGEITGERLVQVSLWPCQIFNGVNHFCIFFTMPIKSSLILKNTWKFSRAWTLKEINIGQ